MNERKNELMNGALASERSRTSLYPPPPSPPPPIDPERRRLDKEGEVERDRQRTENDRGKQRQIDRPINTGGQTQIAKYRLSSAEKMQLPIFIVPQSQRMYLTELLN